ncbi:hypothetical protein AVEN_245823-1 [Araneus ventricosus]|uniref:Uncharacterized protein n=1 Tax=Araneus ventricosus TaxID=182803 RepID=A0A4Y2EC45_ARAVE|nr:hypothetical protein AVEN_245823-1 [Araneus ventricosus]
MKTENVVHLARIQQKVIESACSNPVDYGGKERRMIESYSNKLVQFRPIMLGSCFRIYDRCRIAPCPTGSVSEHHSNAMRLRPEPLQWTDCIQNSMHIYNFGIKTEVEYCYRQNLRFFS